LGLHGREATPEQLERFGEAFKSMLFRSYASALVEYEDDVKIDWRPLRLAPDAKRATVQSTLIRKDAPPVPIGFVMQLKDDGWKVFDLTVENISLVNNFRAQLNNQISRDGLDAVTQKLEGGQIEPEVPGVGEED
ncbi:MAG: ABC transporter substrate-binding protein, partial [Polycyclovorans sp.]